MSRSLPFAGFYAAAFLALGIYLPFWPLWLKGRGLDPAEIGMVVALAFWSRIVATPAVAYLADRKAAARVILIILAALTLASFVALELGHNFRTILWLNLIAVSCLGPQIPLADSLTLKEAKSGNLDYGRVRLWGSFSFILGTLGGGYLLEWFSSDAVLWLLVVAFSLVLAIAPALPRHDTTAAPRGESYRALLRNRSFLLFIVIISLLQSSHAVYYGFSAIHWQKAGLEGWLIGGLWAEGVVAEIILFAVAGRWRLTRSLQFLLFAAAIGGVLRWTLFAATTDPLALAAGQLLHALTFGAAHLATMNFVSGHIPPGLHASALSLNAAVSGGLAMGLAVLASGSLYDAFGGTAFLAMTLLSAFGLPFIVFWRGFCRAED